MKNEAKGTWTIVLTVIAAQLALLGCGSDGPAAPEPVAKEPPPLTVSLNLADTVFRVDAGEACPGSAKLRGTVSVAGGTPPYQVRVAYPPQSGYRPLHGDGAEFPFVWEVHGAWRGNVEADVVDSKGQEAYDGNKPVRWTDLCIGNVQWSEALDTPRTAAFYKEARRIGVAVVHGGTGTYERDVGYEHQTWPSEHMFEWTDGNEVTFRVETSAPCFPVEAAARLFVYDGVDRLEAATSPPVRWMDFGVERVVTAGPHDPGIYGGPFANVYFRPVGNECDGGARGVFNAPTNFEIVEWERKPGIRVEKDSGRWSVLPRVAVWEMGRRDSVRVVLDVFPVSRAGLFELRPWASDIRERIECTAYQLGLHHPVTWPRSRLGRYINVLCETVPTCLFNEWSASACWPLRPDYVNPYPGDGR